MSHLINRQFPDISKKASVYLSALVLGFAVTTSALAAPIDLSHWKLTIPEAGGSSGKAVDIEPEQLRSYSSEWFHAGADGGLVFFAPVGGATTANSHYARSELREQLEPGKDGVNWTVDDSATLTATLKIDRVPDKTGRIIIGQIHGKGMSPMLKLTYARRPGSSSGELFGQFVVEPKAEGDEASETNQKCALMSDVPLGKQFSYTIQVAHETLTYSVAGGGTCTANLAPWRGVGLYFKAGVYVNAKDGGGGGEVEFYELAARH